LRSTSGGTDAVVQVTDQSQTDLFRLTWEALLDFSDFNFYGKALPSDFYKENFEKVVSLINWKSPVPLV
jgi:hypothetical protein